MKALFSKKIENIHNNLMECHRDTKNYSPSIIGAEREIFNREFFQRILPNNYKVGAGTIIDSKGDETGQIDAVIELPFSLSFPISSSENRIYLADTIGAAFEIKSDLNKQWNDAIKKIREIKSLNRYKLGNEEYVLLDPLKIPAFIISFTGPKKIETIYQKLEKVPIKDRPDGIWVIESGVYYGRVAGDNCVYEAHAPSHSTLAFISTIYKVLHRFSHNTIQIDKYRDIL